MIKKISLLISIFFISLSTSFAVTQNKSCRKYRYGAKMRKFSIVLILICACFLFLSSKNASAFTDTVYECLGGAGINCYVAHFDRTGSMADPHVPSGGIYYWQPVDVDYCPTPTSTYAECTAHYPNHFFSITKSDVIAGNYDFHCTQTLYDDDGVTLIFDGSNDNITPGPPANEIPIDITGGLGAYWSFDSCTAIDDSGNGNDGTLYGNPQCVNGEKGKAFSFNGTSDYIEVPSSSQLNPSQAVTISLWAKEFSTSPAYSSLIYKAGQEPTTCCSDRVYSLWTRSDQGIHFASTPEGATNQVYCDTPGGQYSVNEFVHIAGVIDTATHTMSIYVNGNKVQICSNYGDQIRSGTYPLRIGGHFHTLGDQYSFNGIIDEVHIYDRALTDAEIQALYSGYVPPPQACTYAYSDWGACQPDSTQTRTVLTATPDGCTGTPVLSQSCTYVPPKLEVSPTSHDFGQLAAVICSFPQEFTLSNTGSANLNVSSISISDTTNFALVLNGGSNPCSVSNPVIAPGNSCTVGVSFCPSVGGLISANLTITSNDPASPTSASIRGTGIEVFSLSFPLKNYTPYTAPISAVFDHSMTSPYVSKNKTVVAYTGETGGGKHLADCYSNASKLSFIVNGNYTGAKSFGGNKYLCYDSHPGTDYPIKRSTPVVAASNGIVHLPKSFPGVRNAKAFNTIEIDHGNGYKTYYLHSSRILVKEGQPIGRGEQISLSGDVGASGRFHLHFEVQKDGIPVDPYGWQGATIDPYKRAANLNLWAN